MLMHLIENSALSHAAAHITKNERVVVNHDCMVCVCVYTCEIALEHMSSLLARNRSIGMYYEGLEWL